MTRKHLTAKYLYSNTHIGYSLIELIVTTAIMGILIAAVVPALGRFNRDNTVFLAAGRIRQELADIRSYATAPDPSICPLLNATLPLSRPINNYSLFMPVTPTAQTPVADPTLPGSQYECGDKTLTSPSIPQTLTNTQYAILARNIDYNSNGTIKNEYTLGVIRIGSLDSPIQSISPFVSGGVKSILLGFMSPSGSLFLTQTPTANSYNYIPKTISDTVITPAKVVTPDATAINNFALIGLTNPGSVTATIFVNIATGQVTSSGKSPDGFQ